jgi:sigma-B regulation protein RsbU (phosphoserine phosphatase)
MFKNPQITSLEWQKEINATAFKYNVLIVQAGFVLNLFFGIGDYFNSPTHFTDFLYTRIANSIVMIGLLFFKKWFINKPGLIVFIPVTGISIQNAYMYSVLTDVEFQKHTLAYVMLFIAAGMFVLWELKFSVWMFVITLISNIIFFKLNSSMRLEEVMINGALLTFAVSFLSILLIYSRFNLTKKEIIARLALAESNKELAVKNEIIQEKNRDINDSINYALNIQKAVLPPIQKIDNELKDYFILYKPKDVVSGDFYWFDNKLSTPRGNTPAQDIAVIAAVDCTGHGVPGALMSVIGSTILNQTINRATVNNAGDALNTFNKKISETLNSIKDGMDMSLCLINFEKMELQYAGANNPIYIVNKELKEFKATKHAIGADSNETKVFANNIIPLQKGDCIYLFTDGYADQFGGQNGKKLKYGKFKEMLIHMQQHSMSEQKNLLEQEFNNWKGNLEQVDDVLVIGIRI